MPAEYPTSLSPSRALDFMRCPLLFRYRTIDRLPEEPSAAAVRGTLVHRALETLFDLPAAERTSDAAVRLADQALTELEESDPASAQVVRADAGDQVDFGPIVDAYFTLEDPRRVEPHARELRVLVPIESGFSLRGVIDRVDISPTGLVRLVDYKTGRAPNPGFETKGMFQMRFYALAWWQRTGDVPTLLRLMYLGNAQTLDYTPTADDLRSTQRKVLAVRDAIALAADQGEFRPNRSRLCDWCSYRAVCPAWDGTPPPLPPREAWPVGSGPAAEEHRVGDLPEGDPTEPR